MSGRFLGFFRNVFRKDAANGANGANGNGAHHADESVSHLQAVTPQISALPSRNGNGHARTAAPGGVQLPLAPIIANLPLELRSKVKRDDIPELLVTIAFEKILGQLASGSVKIPFGDIRKCAPQVFTPGAECDAIAVLLPLNEVLARLNPSLLVRRSTQKQVEVPAEISSPFSNHGRGAILSVGNKTAEGSAPTTRQAVPTPPAPPVRHSIGSVATPPAPAASQAVPPAAALSHATPLPASRPAFSAQSTAPIRSAQAPASQPVQPAQPAPDAPAMGVPLRDIAQDWPEALRMEIVQLGLVDSRVELPIELVGTALKRGRVAFQWKALRSWLRPTLGPGISMHDALEVELPLSVIAPIFIARQRESAPVLARIDVGEKIPDLFFGTPKPEPAAANGTKPTDTNFYVWDDDDDTKHFAKDEQNGFAPAAKISNTELLRRQATPNEIISRAIGLEGVEGAVIALPDGLKVAGNVPPEMSADTIAAFLPQLFGKVSQATKQLRMGDLNNLNFTVGNAPWKIFRVNALFFAAFGSAGNPLPTADLAALAADLDRKTEKKYV